MAENQTKKKTSWLKAALIIIGLVLALLVVKAVLFFTAKPKIKVNYVAELNRVSKPTDYDPNKNAASYYQKAFDTFVEMPLDVRQPYINWPADYNSTCQVLLEKWLSSNSQAFEYFRIAANKPYYCLERQASENNMYSVLTPELVMLRYLTEAVGWNAKLSACEERFETAFEDILDCYRLGCQKCRTPSLYTEQLIGLSIKRNAVLNALIILDRTSVDKTTMKSFQDSLQAELNKDIYAPDLQAEKLALYDALQRTFIDNGRGTGRLAWTRAHWFDDMCGGCSNLKRRLNCFVGPTTNELIEQIQQLFELFEPLKTLTPWQLKNQDSNYFEKIEAINNSNFFLRVLGISPRSVYRAYHKTRTQTEALLTILAVLRFKAEQIRVPETLNELVSNGYMQSIPIDPYSDGLLVYKRLDNDFKLYSLGEDFEDNGGIVDISYMPMLLPNLAGFYPQLPDIVYWPVRRLEKPKWPKGPKEFGSFPRSFKPPKYKEKGKPK